MKKHLIYLFIALIYLLYFSNFNAIGAVLDSRLVVIILSAAAFTISLFTWFRKKDLSKYFNVFALLLILGISVKEFFFSYNEEDIVFQNDGLNFHGTLYTPKQNNKRCLVVFIHGSGQEERTEYAFHARELVREGISSFVYDKRGSGMSEGQTYDVDYNGYACDAVSAINKLKNLYKFDKIGLFAVSEGEWVSLIVDTLTEIKFIVMVSASGTSPLNQTLRELTYRLEEKKFNQEDISDAKKLYNNILTFNNDSISRIKIKKEIEHNKNKHWFEEGEDFDTDLYYYPWWNNVMNFNPVSYLEKTSTNILVLVGNENQSYPAKETVINFDKYKNIETKIFDSGNHSMIDFRWIIPMFVKGYIDTYTSWVKQNCHLN